MVVLCVMPRPLTDGSFPMLRPGWPKAENSVRCEVFPDFLKNDSMDFPTTIDPGGGSSGHRLIFFLQRGIFAFDSELLKYRGSHLCVCFASEQERQGDVRAAQPSSTSSRLYPDFHILVQPISARHSITRDSALFVHFQD